MTQREIRQALHKAQVEQRKALQEHAARKSQEQQGKAVVAVVERPLPEPHSESETVREAGAQDLISFSLGRARDVDVEAAESTEHAQEDPRSPRSNPPVRSLRPSRLIPQSARHWHPRRRWRPSPLPLRITIRLLTHRLLTLIPSISPSSRRRWRFPPRPAIRWVAISRRFLRVALRSEPGEFLSQR